MSFLLKDPGAILDYAVDWGAEYLAGDVIVQSAFEVSPVEPGGALIAGSTFDLTVAAATVSGGIAGHQYRLVNHVTLLSGREDERTIVLRVEQR
ncbi:MAG: hypothetical protein H0W92_04100 [Sphingomonas sp.]|nr:hypothetical protein [Sphingomonas sp.]